MLPLFLPDPWLAAHILAATDRPGYTVTAAEMVGAALPGRPALVLLHGFGPDGFWAGYVRVTLPPAPPAGLKVGKE